MITNICDPPIQYATFSVHGRVFAQQEDEPYISLMLDGTVDTDLTRQTSGFVNRIQRYGIQNGIDESEWSQEAINFTILQKLPLPIRAKFFRVNGSTSPPQNQMPRAHTAPVPQGLAQAAGFAGVAADDPELPLRLAALSPDQWLVALREWVKQNPEESNKKAETGPRWWFAIHTLALNPPAHATPLNFVGVWLGRYPCRKCRTRARIYIASHPVPGWPAFAQWVDQFHNHVTATKGPL